jgi:hypothetical protein
MEIKRTFIKNYNSFGIEALANQFIGSNTS